VGSQLHQGAGPKLLFDLKAGRFQGLGLLFAGRQGIAPGLFTLVTAHFSHFFPSHIYNAIVPEFASIYQKKK
jgi:hypothetical protein